LVGAPFTGWQQGGKGILPQRRLTCRARVTLRGGLESAR
jgi:hypothetical protein